MTDTANWVTVTITEADRIWSPAKVATLGVTWTDAPLDDLGEALRRAGYRVELLESVGGALRATVEREPVTGETITDKQIREAYALDPNAIDIETFDLALGQNTAAIAIDRGHPITPLDRWEARARCADAYNARHSVDGAGGRP